MSTTLLRRFFGSMLLLALLVAGARPAQASHLLGGEMSYRYLDATGPAATPFRYEITLTVYSNGLYTNSNPNGIAAPPTNAPIDIYNRTTGVRIASYTFNRTSPTPTNANLPPPISPPVPQGCAVSGPSQPFYLCKYVQVVNLPVSFDGYYAVYSVSARNNTLTNINNPNGGTGGNVPLTLYVSMAPPLIYNRSPVFSDTAVAIVCQNDTTISLNNAFDPDGDRLVYSFGTPYGFLTNAATFPPLPQPVPYYPAYSTAAPFGTGAGNFATINASTGIAKYGARTNGLYVVAVDVAEYRSINGVEVLIGTTRRDLQLVVSTCPPTTPPALPTPVITPRNYTIEEGQSLSIPITATQASGNHPLVLTVNSALLDGSGPFNTTFNGSTGVVQAGNLTGTATASGTGSVSGTFLYNSSCGQARTTPYDLGVTVKDNGCGGKLASDIFRVTVTKAAGPNAIAGPATVCDPATVRTYTASGPVSASYRWRITGGTISSGQGTNTVQVTWTSASTTGTLSLKGVSTYGCLSDSVVKTVDIRPLPALTAVAAAPSICQGTSTTLTVSGVAGLTYTWTGGGINSTATTVTVTPAATTTYTVTGTDGTCSVTATVTVTVTAPPTANAGPDRAVCPNVASTPLGVAAIPGLTYSWSPATGLSSATVAQPTVTLPNLGTTNVTQTYTLTVSSGPNCSSTSSVVVTVNPIATVNAGLPVSTCSGVASAPLGLGQQFGYTYSWSPATGLSSPTAAQPTVTLTNTTGAPITQTYTVTATTAAGCTATSTVVVTINPAAVAVPGPAISFCSGTVSAPLGVAVAPSLATYAWSPTTGLSDPTISNPTVTGTNTTGAPIVRIYTLTVTSPVGCVASATVAVTINPAAVADAGPAKATCSNVPVAIGNGTAVAGTTYAWSPTTGLSSASVLNPTVTLPNLTGAPITQTYTLTATTANGCTATNTVVVTIFPAAVAQAGPAVAFCSGETRTLGTGTAVTGTTYAWSPTTGLSSASALNPTVTLTNTTGAPITTTYTLTATTANGCSATSTVAVTVNQAAVADAGPAKATCSNVGVVIGTGTAVAGTTYAWTPATGLSSATALTPTLTLPNLSAAPIVVTYTLTATTASGCVASATVAVTINPAAVADAGPARATCSNVGVAIGNGTAVAGTTYAWSPATGLSSASVLNPTVTLPNLTGAPITQTYTLTATTANGCTATNTVVVTINPAAVANVGANPNLPVCSGSFTDIGIPVTIPGTTYAWTPTTGLTAPNSPSTRVSIVNTTSAPIVYTFTLTATTANGCIATNSVTVTVAPAAVADAGPDAAVCDLKTLTLGTPARAGYTYSWSPTTGLSNPTAAQPVLTASNTTGAPITRTYTVRATDGQTVNQCSTTDAVVVTINPRPLASAIVGPASVCPTVTGIAYSVANPVGTAFTWLVRGGTIASGQGTPAIAVDWGVASTGGYLKVFSLNAQGCSSDTTTLPIVINPRLQTVRPTGPGDVLAVAPLPRSVCQADGPYRYVSGAFANGSSYAWTIIGGTQASTFQNTVTVNWTPVAVPTIGKIVVTETSNPASGVRCLGTSDTLRVLINPSPLPTLAITAPVRVCQTNGPVTFGLPGGFTGSTYVFQLGTTTLAGTGNTRVLNTLPAPGTYTLTAQETTSAGCTGPVYTTSFTVAPTPTAPTISGSGFVCNVAQTQQYAIANPTTGASYQWTVVGGTITAGGTSSQITVRFNPTGPYTMSAAEISAAPASCTGPATTRIILFDSPTVVLTNASVDMASNSRVILTLSVPNSGNTPNPVQVLRRVAGSGSFTSVGTVAASATTFTDNSAVDANANSYEYQLSLTNGCGTANTTGVAQTIRLQATATTTAGGRNQGSTALTWNAFVGFTVKEYRIYRRSDAGASVLLVPQPTITVSGSTLTATVSNNDPNAPATGLGFSQNFRVVAVSTDATPLLSNSNETSVSFANAVKTYNVITPNRDGFNDVLVIDNISLYPGNTFTIFNRWGREVYKTTNYQNNWGGDDSTPAGNYFYILTLPNGTSLKNWFEVIK